MSAFTPYLPWISIIVAVIGLAAAEGAPTGHRPRWPWRWLAASIVLACLFISLAMTKPDMYSGAFPPLAGMFIGGLLATVSLALGRWKGSGAGDRIVPVALAAVAAVFSEMLGDKSAQAAVFGAAAAAWLVSLNDDTNRWPATSAIFLGAITAANYIGSRLPAAQPSFGVYLALAAALAGAIALPLQAWFERRDPKFAKSGPVLALVLFAAGAFLVSQRAGLPIVVSEIVFAAAALAIITSWFVGESSPASSTVRILLAAAIWIGLATAALGLGKAAGVGAALLAAIAGVVLWGGRTALLAIGPFMALVVYRVFRMTNGALSEQFDIAQHYAMIGFLVGAVLPLIAQEWRQTVAGSRWSSSTAAGFLWTLILLAVPIPIAVALSDRGAVAYLIGLGVAPVIEAIRGNRSVLSLALSTGLAYGMAAAYGWLQPTLNFDRHDKIVWLSWFAVPLVVAIVVIAALSSSRTSSRTVEA